MFLELPLGALIVVMVLFDVFESVVVPRWTPRGLRLSPILVDGAWVVWRWIGQRLRSARRREDFLGAFAPLALILVLLAWALVLILGYGLVLHALRAQVRPRPTDLGSVFYLAGTSLFTLGFGDLVAVGGAARSVVLGAGASGAAVMAMVITLMFNLHSSFQRREVLVLSLDARAGAPPSGVALLETYARLEMLTELPALFAAWEKWAAEVLESHRAYPILPFFRSSHENESWVSALGAVLDAAALLLTTVDDGAHGAAKLMHHLGVHTVSDLNYWCGLRCGEEVGVERDEWEEARRRLEAAGFALRDPDESWRSFARVRSEYAGPLNALARHFATPPSQWINDPRATAHRGKGRHPSSQANKAPAGAPCTHLDQVRDVTPRAAGCEECMAMGARWVHLRLCRTCGHVGCCDSSPHKHATAHFHATGHPIVQSLEPGENWNWCYVDQMMVDAPENRTAVLSDGKESG